MLAVEGGHGCGGIVDSNRPGTPASGTKRGWRQVTTTTG